MFELNARNYPLCVNFNQVLGSLAWFCQTLVQGPSDPTPLVLSQLAHQHYMFKSLPRAPTSFNFISYYSPPASLVTTILAFLELLKQSKLNLIQSPSLLSLFSADLFP